MFRDRSTLFYTVLFPFFIILVIGTSTKNLGDVELPLGVVNGSSGPLTTELIDSLEDSPVLQVVRMSDVEDVRREVRRGGVGAGVIIPKDYETRTQKGEPVFVDFAADIARTPTVVRAAVSSAVARQGAFLQAAGFATRHTDRPFAQNLAEARKVAEIVPSVGVKTETIGEQSTQDSIMAGFEYTAPSNLILFVFITSLAASSMIIAARQQGIMRRMYATPTTAGSVIAGETLARFAIALFQAIYIVLLGILVFSVDFGSTAGAIALITIFALVGTAFAILAGTLFRTPEQAGSIGPPLGIAMGMLAGCMWPRFIMPVPMQRIGQVFPHAWAMDAFIKLIARDAGVTDILPELAVLAGFVLVLLPLATWRLRRTIIAG